MRVLVGKGDNLDELYGDVPRTPWLRANFVTSVDGAATGSDGLSGSINNQVDHEVFEHLRAISDVVIVGAGTLREENYAPMSKPLVVLSRRAEVPHNVLGGDAPVYLATFEAAEGLDAAKELLGEDNVLILGSHRVDLAALKETLAGLGYQHQLCEGGPHVFRDLCDEDALDELCSTVVPRIVGGLGPRMTDGPPVDLPDLELHTLVESEGTLLFRWFLAR